MLPINVRAATCKPLQRTNHWPSSFDEPPRPTVQSSSWRSGQSAEYLRLSRSKMQTPFLGTGTTRTRVSLERRSKELNASFRGPGRAEAVPLAVEKQCIPYHRGKRLCKIFRQMALRRRTLYGVRSSLTHGAFASLNFCRSWHVLRLAAPYVILLCHQSCLPYPVSWLRSTVWGSCAVWIKPRETMATDQAFAATFPTPMRHLRGTGP